MITEYLQDAIIAIDKVNNNIKVGILLDAEEVALLLTLIEVTKQLRHRMIQHDLMAGVSGQQAAVKYNLSTARISQIRRIKF